MFAFCEFIYERMYRCFGIGLGAVMLLLSGCRTSAPAFAFVVFGDNQCAVTSSTSGVPERQVVPLVIKELQPAFVLHTGDLMDRGEHPEAYPCFYAYYREMLATAPFFPTLGNHDALGVLNYKAFLGDLLCRHNPQVYSGDFARDFAVCYEDDPICYPLSFSAPERHAFMPDVPTGVNFKTNYAFRYRNAYFISMEVGTRWWSNTPRSWLERHLQQAAGDSTIQHIFVWLHHPIYSVTMRESPPDSAKPSSGECLAPVREAYEPLFQKYRVSMVFSGHVHAYEHYYVPADHQPTAGQFPDGRFPGRASGVHYQVTGGGGGPLNRSKGRNNEVSNTYLQQRFCTYHILQVSVNGGEVQVQALQISGTPENPVSTAAESYVIGHP